jgi:pimeloyl-ACP methyl ester carboxylesterase
LYGGSQVVLVGHSLGCRIALQSYHDAPEAVVGLVLIEQSLVAGNDAEAAAQSIEARVRAVGFPEFIHPMFSQMFLPDSDPSLRNGVLVRVKRMENAFATDILLSAVRWEAGVRALLERVAVPLLMVQSTFLDEQLLLHSMPEGAATRWTQMVRSAVPSAQLRIVPRVGHFAQIEAPDVVNAHIASFVSGLQSAAVFG